ncbi:cell division protein ZipA [Thioalkalivibrio sp.]|uniref:cell division protein ZipA n=1 Tax=Thioalkalivibrio sp. TaxID=2093813 RepID=UPI0012D667D6|nr:cell division protein ZipA [Thioalkalivibrio sp.]TVP81543.1 MAG: cell division protein ZipA [Thioalkalivibrio sp.]
MRISLLILGVILVAGIWVAHRVRERGRREARMREMDDWAEDGGVHIRAHRDDHEIEPTLGGITTELDQLLEAEDRGVSRPPRKAGREPENRASVPRGTAEPELPEIKTKPGREAKREAGPESRPESRPASRPEREPEPRAESKPAPTPETETDAWQQVLRKPASVLSGLKERIGRLRETEPARPAGGDGAAEQRQPAPAKTVAAERFEDVSEPRVVGRNPLARGPGKDKILVLHVVAPRNRPFTGVALGAALRRAGLKPGEMSIYHYHEEGAADREPLFSVANMVAPGTLTDENLSDMMTPGITLFLQVHLCDRPQRAFEVLLETSHVLARDLGGRIMDAQQSTATNQTLAHMREDMNQWLLRHRPELLRRKASR